MNFGMPAEMIDEFLVRVRERASEIRQRTGPPLHPAIA